MDSTPRFTFASVRPGRAETVIHNQTFLVERSRRMLLKGLEVRNPLERKVSEDRERKKATMKVLSKG